MASADQPLAIVGIGCRLPGNVIDRDSYWELLINKRSGVREVPPDRWDWRKFYHPNPEAQGRMVSRWGAFIDGYDLFDPGLFGISPREAQYMDPQQRWLLETSWRALEDAGIAPGRLAGEAVGVFVGISTTELGDRMHGDDSLINFHSGTGGALSIAANRISFTFNLQGPSMAVDTACSSALVAIALAAREIRAGHCGMALAGGVNALLSPKITMSFSKASMLSPDGQCFTFDARANGYVRGEGAGMVLIKPLAQALVDGDRIHALIRGVSVNQDGHSSSLTVPSMEAQEAMLRAAYLDADFDPAQVSYVEAHGTGTPVGDPIEAHALGHVLGANRPAERPCLIGSVKTNIGHLEPASGIAGLIKAALVLQHEVIPPNRNFEKANPFIPLGELGLEVVSEACPLPRLKGQAPVVGVNSFGFGGTNAHVVLEQAPPPTPCPAAAPTVDRPVVVTFSAADEEALAQVVDRGERYLAESETPIRHIATALAERREALYHRMAVIGSDQDELRRGLREFLDRSSRHPGVFSGQPAIELGQPVFVYTGQGAQWWGMGQQLLEREPVYRESVEEIEVLFRALSGWSLIEEMRRGEAESRIDDTDVAQPAIFALQVGLTRLWESWGVGPAKVLGHSVGEVAAAYVAGIYTLEDAVRIIYHRSRLQHGTAGSGAMAAVGLSLGEMLQRMNGHAAQIAAVNSSHLITLAGEIDTIRDLSEELSRDGVFVRELPIQYAFHSSYMDPIRAELLDALRNIQAREARLPFYSTVTGERFAGEQMDAGYWWRNVREPVSFSATVHALIAEGDRCFVEIGPHPALLHSINENLGEAGVRGQVFTSLRRESDDSIELVSSLAAMHLAGLPVDWEAVNQGDASYLELPPYPMQRQPYGVMSSSFRQFSLQPYEHPLLGLRIAGPKPTWEQRIDPKVLDYLADHRIWDSIVFPAAAYTEMAVALGALMFPEEPQQVEDLRIKKALFVQPQAMPTLRMVFEPADRSFAIYSNVNEQPEWQLHVVGTLRPRAEGRPGSIDAQALRAQLTHRVAHDAFYADLRARGYDFGPQFRQIQNIWADDDLALSEVLAPENMRAQLGEYHIHPVLLDACLQTFAAAIDEDHPAKHEELPYLPAGLDRLRLFSAAIPERLWVVSTVVEDGAFQLVINANVHDEAGQLLADLKGLRLDRVQPGSTLLKEDYNHIYAFRWEARRLRSSPLPALQAPDNAVLIAAVDAARPNLEAERGLRESIEMFNRQLPAVAQQALINALLALGWAARPGERFTLDGLMDQLGILRRHRALLYQQLETLAEVGRLRVVEDEEWEVVSALKAQPIEAWIEAIVAEHAGSAPDAALLSQVASALPKLLRGLADPLRVLFPDGAATLLEAFYAENLEQAAIYELMAAAIEPLLATCSTARPLRILEVGAGTGALTRALLARLPQDRIEYCFTDIGPSFVKAAQRQFAGGAVDCQVFDLSQHPAEQGLPWQGFDMVLAANVLHTVPGAQEALGHLRECLAPDGLLMFMEITRSNPALNLIFGLLPEWWRSEAEGSRLALQSAGVWQEQLDAAGWKDIQSFDLLPEGGTHLSVMLARAPEGAAPAGEACAETILIFAGDSGPGEKLAELCRGAGMRVLIAAAGEAFEECGEGHYLIDARSREDLRRLIAAADHEAQPLKHIVQAWTLDNAPIESMDAGALAEAQQGSVFFALRLAQVLAERDASQSPQVLLLSREACVVLPDDRCEGLAASTLMGFLRVLNNEYVDYRWRLIDLGAKDQPEEAEALFHELTEPDGELEAAYRGGQRYAHRLKILPLDELPPTQQAARQVDGSVLPYRLQMTRPGRLSNLRLNRFARCAPGPGEIEVAVAACGLNFRDVMKTLGFYPGNTVDLRWLGDDIAGRVMAVGEGVTAWQPGDEVLGFASYAFSSQVTVDQRQVIRKPREISFAEAASIPTVFATAVYALVRLAQMRPGESILIHAGAGGVGQAAIQVAQELGLDIFATAGSQEKRDFLRAQGVPHVMNSRTLDFADEIMEITGGRGVDAVLNSLAGPFIPRSMSVLAPYGRFVEIGKIDIYNNSALGLEALRNNISLHVLDMSQMIGREGVERLAPLLAGVQAKLEAGTYRPLPITVYPISEAVEAFRSMAGARHIGKIVLSFEDEAAQVGVATSGSQRFSGEGSILIAGGTRGFGLEVARWLASEGARHFTLMSRRGLIEAEAEGAVDALRDQGVSIRVAQGDIAVAEDVERVVAEIQAGPAPLMGVIHSAMLLRDGLISEQQDEDQWAEALWVKALGGWNLHRATLGLPLEFFICFSSSSSMFGGAAQSNYAAGNAFLDALAHYRRAQGLPALTVNYGALGGAGYLSRDSENAAFLDALGLKLMPFRVAIEMLSELMLHALPQAGSLLADWNRVGQAMPSVMSSKVYQQIQELRGTASNSGGLLAQILEAPPAARPAMLRRYLTQTLAEVLDVDAERIDLEAPLTHLGLDSLMSVELVNQINSELGPMNLQVAISEVLGASTIEDIAVVLMRKFEGAEGLQELGLSEAASGRFDLLYGAQSGPGIEVDYETETQLDPAIQPWVGQSAPAGPAQHILLTGGSGFLGAFVLYEALKQTNARITCLVRAEDNTAARQRIEANQACYGLSYAEQGDRIEALAGDLTLPLFGLRPEDYTSLAEEVDLVLHNASSVNLALPYHALRAANVRGVEEMLRFSVEGRLKALHYVSTISVFYQRAGDEKPLLESEWGEPTRLNSGYRRSKWVAEQLVRKAIERGIPCTIYRPGIITGDSVSGASSTVDAASRIVKGVQQLGIYSDRDSQWNLVPVDYVSKAILYLAQQPDVAGRTFHLTHPQNTRQQDIIAWIGKERPLQKLSYHDWRMALVQQAQHQIENDLIALLPLFPEKPTDEIAPIVDSEATRARLAEAGIHCPPVNEALMKTYQRSLAASGALV